MDKYIVMLTIVKEVVKGWRLLLVPASILCWKLPDILSAVLK